MIDFKLNSRKVKVFSSMRENRGLVYVNYYNGEQIWERLLKQGIDINIISIDVSDWYCDLVPWDIESPFNDKKKYMGGAKEYLEALISDIIPQAESLLPHIKWRGIAGYSLGGLFSVWALYNCNAFTRVASCSGSFWCQGFLSYVLNNQLQNNLECAFFSLGNKEISNLNLATKTVGVATKYIVDRYTAMGINTKFLWEEGNHSEDPIGRIVRAVKWISKE